MEDEDASSELECGTRTTKPQVVRMHLQGNELTMFPVLKSQSCAAYELHATLSLEMSCHWMSFFTRKKRMYDKTSLNRTCIFICFGHLIYS